jgi:nitrate reductase NapE component
MRAYRVILRVVLWVIVSVALVAVGFWVYAIVTGGKNF